MISRNEFSREFAERYGITYTVAEELTKEFFELLGDLVFKEGQDVVIKGFGSFKHKQYKAKRVRHPLTGELITIDRGDCVKFTASNLFKEE